MSPAIGRSSALQQIESSVGLETRDRITLDLYPVLLLAEQNFKKKKKLRCDILPSAQPFILSSHPKHTTVVAMVTYQRSLFQQLCTRRPQFQQNREHCLQIGCDL